MSLHQIIYTSHAARLMSGEELVRLLEHSRSANAAAGITGLLLHADGSFMQAIEGDPAAVHALFERIKRDPTHGGIILICDEPITQRSYADWSMAFREISPADAARLPGFHLKRESINKHDRDLARNLMHTFLMNAALSRRA
jgi:hypothetical protein